MGFYMVKNKGIMYNTTCLLLGTGTSITQPAMRMLALFSKYFPFFI